MALTSQLFMAKVMHKRFFPRENAFTYSVYYLSLPLRQLENLPQSLVFAVDKPAFFSFYRKDYGARDGSSLNAWAVKLFSQYGYEASGDEIVLITMPRIFGYAFNPVSFWMAYDESQALKAVIAEVNNTFGETHSYLCMNKDGAAILPDQWLQAEKLFHVSPFLERTGTYAFRFHDAEKTSGKNFLGIWIDYFHEKGQRQLATSLIGQRVAFTTRMLLKAFFAIPFVTLKTITLIHWQAVVLALKKIRYIDKPTQKEVRSSAVKPNLTDL